MLECCVRAAGASTRLLKGRPFLIILLAWGATQLQNIDTATQNTYALHVDLQGLTMGQQTALPFSATQDNETIFTAFKAAHKRTYASLAVCKDSVHAKQNAPAATQREGQTGTEGDRHTRRVQQGVEGKGERNRSVLLLSLNLCVGCAAVHLLHHHVSLCECAVVARVGLEGPKDCTRAC
jgi:hypothetical protein